MVSKGTAASRLRIELATGIPGTSDGPICADLPAGREKTGGRKNY
jgi:hypothetical protein